MSADADTATSATADINARESWQVHAATWVQAISKLTPAQRDIAEAVAFQAQVGLGANAMDILAGYIGVAAPRDLRAVRDFLFTFLPESGPVLMPTPVETLGGKIPAIRRMIVRVTPRVAATWLSTINTGSYRPVNLAVMHKLVAIMRERGWIMDGADPITFGADGRLSAGRVRLNAVIEYGQPVHMWVVMPTPIA